MLETLEISNFQNHKSIQIEFDRHITTIIGPSDVGKSAILRALKWVCLNTPQGDGFVKDGEKVAEVTLTVNGVKIVRRRTKGGDNLYRLDKQDYRAFSNGVPTEILELLRLDLINFVGQHEPAFWFSLSSGEVSRQLNAIVNLGVIDDSLTNIQRVVRKNQEDLRVCRERLVSARDQREALQWVEECDTEFSYVESLEKEKNKWYADRSKIQCLIIDYHTVNNKFNRLSEFCKDIDDVGKTGQQAMKNRTLADTLARGVDRISDLKVVAERTVPDTTDLEKAIGKIQSLSTKRGILFALADQTRTMRKQINICPDFEPVENAHVKLKETRFKAQRLENFLIQVKPLQEDIEIWQERYDQASRDLEEIQQGDCPICGNPISSHAQNGHNQ